MKTATAVRGQTEAAGLRTRQAHLKRAGAAARQDMEFRSTLAVARHHVENLLAALFAGVGGADPSALGSLLRSVHVVADDGQGERGPVPPHRLPAWFAPDLQPVLLTSSSLSVEGAHAGLTYAGVYQVWEADRPFRCLGHGTFHGRLDAGPQVWTWTEHTFLRMAREAGTGNAASRHAATT